MYYTSILSCFISNWKIITMEYKEEEEGNIIKMQMASRKRNSLCYNLSLSLLCSGTCRIFLQEVSLSLLLPLPHAFRVRFICGSNENEEGFCVEREREMGTSSGSLWGQIEIEREEGGRMRQ